MNRRTLLALMAAASLTTLLPGSVWAAGGVDVNAILNDPGAPVGGNPKGDVTIVAFFDYNCPYCKKAQPVIDELVRTDGNIRLVYKDWPILTPASVKGAHMALAAGYQGKYEQAHAALMGIDGGRVSAEQMRAALKAAGIDMARLDADMDKNATTISDLVARTNAQAEALGLPGTPVFLIGPFMVPAALDLAGYRQVVSDARDRKKAGE